MTRTHADYRLIEAIELVKNDQREQALVILRALIQENSNDEAAWLWMSVAVESIDYSAVCLDNVLRVNPQNQYAAGALYRLKETEMQMQKRRERYRFYRDVATGALWLVVGGLMLAVLLTYLVV